MLHAVFLLVGTRELMLLDDTIEIVLNVGTHHKTILSLAIHGLCIDVVLLLLVLNKPAVILEFLESLSGTFIHAWVILAGAFWKIDFRFDDVVERHFVIACFCTCFF